MPGPLSFYHSRSGGILLSNNVSDLTKDLIKEIEISSSKEHIRIFLHNARPYERSCSLLGALRNVIDNAHRSIKVLVVTPAVLRSDWKSLSKEFDFKDVRIVDGNALRQAKNRVRLDKSVWSGTGVKIVSMDFIKNPVLLSECLTESWDLVVLDEAHQFDTTQRSQMANAIWTSDNVRTCVVILRRCTNGTSIALTWQTPA